MYSSLTNNSVLRSHSQLLNSWISGPSTYSSRRSMTKSFHQRFCRRACILGNGWNNHPPRQQVDRDLPWIKKVMTIFGLKNVLYRCSIVEKQIPRKDQTSSFHCSSWCCAYIRLLHWCICIIVISWVLVVFSFLWLTWSLPVSPILLWPRKLVNKKDSTDDCCRHYKYISRIQRDMSCSDSPYNFRLSRYIGNLQRP